jgi:hypothetical protein
LHSVILEAALIGFVSQNYVTRQIGFVSRSRIPAHRRPQLGFVSQKIAQSARLRWQITSREPPSTVSFGKMRSLFASGFVSQNRLEQPFRLAKCASPAFDLASLGKIALHRRFVRQKSSLFALRAASFRKNRLSRLLRSVKCALSSPPDWVRLAK